MRDKTNFVAVTLLIAAVLLVCQLFGLSLDFFDSDYESNKYANLRFSGPVPATPAPATPAPTETPLPTETPAPNAEATRAPTAAPTRAPSVEATAAPISEATAAPIPEATAAPILEATAAPILEATAAPIPEATRALTAAPNAEATAAPIPAPNAEAAATPISEATRAPSVEATTAPIPEATTAPSVEATAASILKATRAPSVEATATPIPEATRAPSVEATAAPIPEATSAPSIGTTSTEATNTPTAAPNAEATAAPIPEATRVPSVEATAAPNAEATSTPSVEATTAPILEATETPILEATAAPILEAAAETEAEAEAEARAAWLSGIIQGIEYRPEAPVAIVAASETAAPAAFDACRYMQRPYARRKNLAEALSEPVAMLVWTATSLDLETDLPLLLSCAEAGIPIVFARMPEVTLILRSAELRGLLGVGDIVAGSRTVRGVKLFEGFLLGGGATYDDMRVSVPHVKLLAGYKVYMVGLLGDDKATREGDNIDMPPLLWRYSTGANQVFVVNGDYLTRHDGAGIFAAIVAESESLTVYPVVNAQTVSLLNFPFLSSENEERMHEWYSMNSEQMLNNVLMPDIISVLSANRFRMTAMFTSCLDASRYTVGPDAADLLAQAIRQIVGQSGEMGLSGHERSGMHRTDKLSSDVRLLEAAAASYTVRAFAPGDMPASEYVPMLTSLAPLHDIRTVLTPLALNSDVDTVRYLGAEAICLPTTNDGYSHASADDLRMRGMQTILALSNVSIDMERVVYPRGDHDDWAELGRDWGKSLGSYWKPFEQLARLTLSEAGQRGRDFLNVRFQVACEGETVRWTLRENCTHAFFILRARGKRLEVVENLTATRLEEGVYLLEVTGETATATLKPVQEIFFREDWG